MSRVFHLNVGSGRLRSSSTHIEIRLHAPLQVLLEETRNLNLHLIVLHLITLSERGNLWTSEHAVRGKFLWLVERLKNTLYECKSGSV